IHNLSAQASDAAGNTSALSAPLVVIVDTTPPATPSTPQLTPASDSGISNTDNITSITSPAFTGAAENGTAIVLLDGAVPLGSAVAAGGTWAISVSALANGVHSLKVKSTDAAGNSTSSAVAAVTIDNIAPLAPSIPDLDPASDTGSSNVDNITDVTTP